MFLLEFLGILFQINYFYFLVIRKGLKIIDIPYETLVLWKFYFWIDVFILVFGYFISGILLLLLVALKIWWLNEGLDVTELAKL